MKIVSEKQLIDLISRAKKDKRKRAFERLHKPTDKVLKLVNAIQPESYIPPHKHGKERAELFVALKGLLIAIFFDEKGDVREAVHIGANSEHVLVEVPGNTWHTLWAIEKDSVVLEIIQGPYDEATHKINASWAPNEGSVQVKTYMESVIEFCKMHE